MPCCVRSVVMNQRILRVCFHLCFHQDNENEKDLHRLQRTDAQFQWYIHTEGQVWSSPANLFPMSDWEGKNEGDVTNWLGSLRMNFQAKLSFQCQNLSMLTHPPTPSLLDLVSHFHAVCGKNWLNNRLAPPLLLLWGWHHPFLPPLRLIH